MPTVVVGDRYQICRRVGDGGMARVYLAWDTRLRLWCALKVMTLKAVEDPILRARFVHEARALARLSHRNLVRFYDLAGEVQTPYMAMEYVEGGTVAARISEGPLPPRAAAQLAADVASALQAAHDAGIVHRDIKPHNLLLDRDGGVKLSDFGVARVERERRLTVSNMSLGTLAYMPPEQQRDAAQVDHRVDVYALGATLWAMVTGRRPTGLITGERDRALQVLPAPLEAVIRKATEPKVADRYATAADLERALRVAAEALPPDPAGIQVVTDLRLVPTTPPSVSDIDAEPGEFDGTERPYRPSEPATGRRPSTAATLKLDDDVLARDAPALPAPPPPPRSSWGFGRVLLLGGVLVVPVVCAGGCAGLTCAGLLPLL